MIAGNTSDIRLTNHDRGGHVLDKYREHIAIDQIRYRKDEVQFFANIVQYVLDRSRRRLGCLESIGRTVQGHRLAVVVEILVDQLARAFGVDLVRPAHNDLGPDVKIDSLS